MLKKVLYKIVPAIFIVLILLALIASSLSEIKNHLYFKPTGFISISFLGCAFLLLLFFLLSPLKGKKAGPSIVIGIISLLFFPFLLLITRHYFFYTGWDAGVVSGFAKVFVEGKSPEYSIRYFSIYPNNFTLACLYALIYKIASYFVPVGYYYALIAFQCFIFSLCAYLTYRVTSFVSDMRCAILAYIVYILLIGLSPWVTVPYSDAMGLFFPLALIYLYFIRKKTDKLLYKVLLSFLISFLAYIAFKIKPQLFITFISLLLTETVSLSKDQIKNKIPGILSSVLGYSAGILCVSILINSFNLPLDQEREMSIWYYFCLGSNIESDGACNIPDQDFAFSFETKSERNTALKELYTSRLKENGLVNTINLFIRKNRLNYSDGTFGWFKEDPGRFNLQEGSVTNSNLHAFLSSIYYESGYRFRLFVFADQVLWRGVLIFCTLSVFLNRKNSNIFPIALALLGLTVFEMIFEARARYIFSYAPLFITLINPTIWKGQEN